MQKSSARTVASRNQVEQNITLCLQWSAGDVRIGHAALADPVKFGAEKLSMQLRSSEPATGVPQHPATSGTRRVPFHIHEISPVAALSWIDRGDIMSHGCIQTTEGSGRINPFGNETGKRNSAARGLGG